MRRLVFVSAIAACMGLMAGVALATPDKKPGPGPRVAAKRLVEVRVCPIMGFPVQGKGGDTSVFGKYKVYFCCESCKPTFEKLTPAEKTKKVAAALKKQKSAAGHGKSGKGH